MSGYLNLKDVSFQGSKEANKSNVSLLNGLVDDIVYDLVNKNPKLIIDVEKGIIPVIVLEQEIISYIDNNKVSITNGTGREELIKEVKNYIFGYGPLQELVDNEDISDIKIINKDNTRIKVKGRRRGANVKFATEKSLLTYCYYLAIKNGGSLSELNAIQKLSDPNTSKDFLLRINICIKPINSQSPSVTIRKIPRKKLRLEDLLTQDMFNIDMYLYLLKAIRSGLNIIACGKGASGKTTILNSMLDYIPHTESCLVMQESVELHSNHPDMVFQTVKTRKGESDIECSLKDLTINGLLMDLDRMIIGEIKGEESMDFFNAIYTGHIGWTSIHAPSSTEALNKAVHLMKYSKTDLSRDTLLEMLSEIDLVIYMKNFKCVELTEIEGYDYRTNRIIFNPVFKYEITKQKDGKIKGYFKKINESCPKVLSKFNITELDLEEMESEVNVL